MIILLLMYDLIFLLGLLIYLPVYFYRKKITFAALKEKLGFFNNFIPGKKSIWIHVVSVGEANLIETFVKKINTVFNYSIIISTTTLTGNKVAKKKYASFAKVIFFPLDISFIVKKVIRLINPKIFITVETEIWPNLFHQLKKKNIPIVIINGRISNKAFQRYKYIKPVIEKILNNAAFIAVQNEFYKKRFISLGCAEEKLTVSGNMKFESISINEDHFLRTKNKFQPLLKDENQLLIVAGSTHYPEEEIIINIYKDLIKSSPNISLLIAPRHIERVPLIEKTIRSFGFIPKKISVLEKNDKQPTDIFILDIIGELLYFYSISDICFIGGSLIKHGGQNILEPIYFLKPTIFGQYMYNFTDIEEVVLNKGAGIKVEDPGKLKEVLLGLIKDVTLRNNLCGKCVEVFEGERRSLDKNLHIIQQCLK